MSVPFHTTPKIWPIKNEMFNRTVAVTLPAGVTGPQALGRALTLDPTKPTAMKLTGDGDIIVARLEVYEDRGLGTAQFRWSDLMPIAAGDAIAVGDTAVGAANGFVKKAPTNAPHTNWVAEIVTRGGQKYAAVVRL